MGKQRLGKRNRTVIEVRDRQEQACQYGWGWGEKQNKRVRQSQSKRLKENPTHSNGEIMIRVKHRFGPRPAAPGHREVKRATSISKERQDRLLNGLVPPLPATTE